MPMATGKRTHVLTARSAGAWPGEAKEDDDGAIEANHLDVGKPSDAGLRQGGIG
jgi:hypothetical protein